jgi:transposase
MKNNSSIPLGGIVLMKKVEKRFGVFKELFTGIGGKSKDFLPCVKLHVYNKLTHSVSTHQIAETYPEEIAEYIGMKEIPAERSLYRALERVGKNFPIILDRYQQFIKKHGLADSEQVIDFSFTYFEGSKAELAEFGYSRDKRPDKQQINFGIATGINEIPTAITIQKGNVQDKKHIREMLKLVSKVIPQRSLLIFDTGANCKDNKTRIKGMDYNYLTLKAKKVSTYFLT